MLEFMLFFNLMQLQGVEEPQRKFFWPAALLWHNDDDDDDGAAEDEDDEDDLLSVRNTLTAYAQQCHHS